MRTWPWWVALQISSNWDKIIIASFIHPRTRFWGSKMVYHFARHSLTFATNMGRSAALEAGVTRAGTRSAAGRLATRAAPIALGYVVGAVVGTAIAQAVWGDEGAEDALDFYGGGILEEESWDRIWWAITTPSAW
jgi:hypothetical protein